MPEGTPLPGEDDNRATASALFGPSFTSLDRAIRLSVDLIERAGGARESPWRPRKTGVVVLGLYAKAIKTARSIRLVTSAGFLEDGFVLCRTMLETYVAICYIVQRKGKRRAEEYIASLPCGILKVAEEWERTKGLKREGKRLRKLAQEALANDFTHIPADRQKALKAGYAGQQLKTTFKNLGMIKDYQVVYRDLSSYQHANDLQGHVNVEVNRGLELRLGTADKPEVRKVLDTARRILVSTMYRVSQTMDLGHLAEIARMGPSRDDTIHALLKSWKRRVSRTT